MTEQSDPNYVMGHTRPGAAASPPPGGDHQSDHGDLLRRAGLSAGMTVLDLGCGVGEVSIMSARLIGRRGKVVALDIDEGALETARSRADGRAMALPEAADNTERLL
jgi:ubiquinone/menaquinone biosynthesis C-methylase UbiE